MARRRHASGSRLLQFNRNLRFVHCDATAKHCLHTSSEKQVAINSPLALTKSIVKESTNYSASSKRPTSSQSPLDPNARATSYSSAAHQPNATSACRTTLFDNYRLAHHFVDTDDIKTICYSKKLCKFHKTLRQIRKTAANFDRIPALRSALVEALKPTILA